MELDEAINKFRLASRELFNNYFHVHDPYNNDGWVAEERFSTVEEVLYDQIVGEPFGLSDVPYGQLQPEVVVKINSDVAPWMLNRGVGLSHGYWDHPITEVSAEACLKFVGFFDFSQLDYKDNRYVVVFVEAWKEGSEAVGRYALLETQYVRYCKSEAKS